MEVCEVRPSVRTPKCPRKQGMEAGGRIGAVPNSPAVTTQWFGTTQRCPTASSRHPHNKIFLGAPWTCSHPVPGGVSRVLYMG